ncbi:hypothetical protein Cfor_12985, partial [Coptotermes formosanus]
MALETDRSSPSSASSPGPASSTRPGSDCSTPINGIGTPDSCSSLCCNSNSPQATSILHTPSASHETPQLIHHTPQPPTPLVPASYQEQPCQCCGPVSPLTYAESMPQNVACRSRSPRSSPSSPSHNNQSICNPVHTRTPPFSSPSPHPSSLSPSHHHNQPLKPLPSPPSNTSRTSFSSPSPQSSLPPSPSHNRPNQCSPPEYQQQGSSPSVPSPHPTHNERVPQTTTLPFSVANILRPDFGRRAVITSKQQEPVFRPGGIRRTVTPICDYQRLYRPHDHLSGVQPLPAPKPTKKQTSAWSPVTATSRPTPTVPTERPDFRVSARESSNHQQARNKAVSPPAPTSGTASPPLSPASSTVSAASSNPDEKLLNETTKGPQLWPAWVYCTRYSDRPSS